MNRVKHLESLAFMPLFFYQYGKMKRIDADDLSFADVEYLVVSSLIIQAIPIPEVQL